MATFAQLVQRQALNVITGPDLEAALKNFVPGYDGGHPGVPWEQVMDGTQSGAFLQEDGSAQNPDGTVINADGSITAAPPPPAPPNPTTKKQLQDWLQQGAALIAQLP